MRPRKSSPRSLRQRCLAHKIRNLEAKVPAELWREVKARAIAAYQAVSPMLAELAREEFVKRFERELPSATACFLDNFPACIAHLRLPIAHRRFIRTTNLLERLFGEERRRTKVIPHAFGERAALKLMYAALIRASQGWRRVVISEHELRKIEELKTQLDEEFKQRTIGRVIGIPAEGPFGPGLAATRRCEQKSVFAFHPVPDESRGSWRA